MMTIDDIFHLQSQICDQTFKAAMLVRINATFVTFERVSVYDLDGGHSIVHDELLQRARQALTLEESSGQSDEIYLSVIRDLSDQFSNNQKEIANALKTMASQIETCQGAAQAFQFKQRTCEMLLRHNIEQRHAQRSLTKVEIVGGNERRGDIIGSAAKADVSDLPSDIVANANIAAQNIDPEESERQLTALIASLENFHNHNEREIAATLQRLSHNLDDEKLAFNFKQRTCEVMLKLSMARRRNDKR